MRRILLASTVLVACGACSTESDPEVAPGVQKEVVTVGAISTPTMAPAGATKIAVPVVIADDYKIQANPAANEFLVPLEVEFEPTEGIVVGVPEYPAARRHRLKGADEDLLVYQDEVSVALPVSATPSAPPGTRVVQGTLRYQACDTRSCLMPAFVPVEFKIVVSN